jgi:hypothetical protein
MLAIAILATLLALIQNLIMFAGGMKESAIYSSPLFFYGDLSSRDRADLGGVCLRAEVRPPETRTRAGGLRAPHFGSGRMHTSSQLFYGTDSTCGKEARSQSNPAGGHFD